MRELRDKPVSPPWGSEGAAGLEKGRQIRDLAGRVSCLGGHVQHHSVCPG